MSVFDCFVSSDDGDIDVTDTMLIARTVGVDMLIERQYDNGWRNHH